MNLDRLSGRLEELGRVGALKGGGVCRLALTDEDRRGRDLVVGWMKELGLAVTVDRIGNVVGVRPGTGDGPPVVAGSHIDTVATGGIYDGCLGVLAGLEAIAVLNEAEITTCRPLAVAFFTNEEGARFAPDMMGSAVSQGILDLDEVLATTGIDDTIVADDLAAIGYAGEGLVGDFRAYCYFELHIEQGPVLDLAGETIGAVTGVQGIYWTEFRISGVANHAGTTPMQNRHDAGYVAARIAVQAREIARAAGGNQVANAGFLRLGPGLVNVVAGDATVTIDFRNTDVKALKRATDELIEFAEHTAAEEGCEIAVHPHVRLDPVEFDGEMVALVEDTARAQGRSVRRMHSGAGHDAQTFAANCPAAMIFVPSQNGISHNVTEYTAPEDIRAGADVLLQALLEKAGEI
ncbi:MAG: M20 family metallo-hydrolase [Rhodospirillales bacterium]|nr:M20 family metallo-hydrolase [Rhodospirillales bacterium]